jgi:hypothetical protein
MKNNKPNRWLTPPEIAQEFGVDIGKVYTWIRSGELKAIDAAVRKGGRPRFRIDPKELEAFKLRRSVLPLPKMPSRRGYKLPAGFVEFF